MKKQKIIYVVSNEDGNMAQFDTMAEAKAFIRGAKRFDQAHGNPFEEHYTIDREVEEVDA